MDGLGGLREDRRYPSGPVVAAGRPRVVGDGRACRYAVS
jgi:hypothetical protein